jgi:ADP-ribosylglycohydrolase
MRMAPVLVPHISSPSSALWEDAVLAGAVTHNDPTSIAACVAFVGMLWDLLSMTAAPQPAWWLDAFLARARPRLTRSPRRRPSASSSSIGRGSSRCSAPFHP